MSQETLEWLNNNVLTGFIEDREKWAGGWGGFKDDNFRPWFADENYSGGYPGPIPVDAINERLFNWQAVEAPLYMRVPCDDISKCDGIGDDGNAYRNVVVPDWKAIARSDNDFMFKPFKDGYTVHQYSAWLLDEVAAIIDDEVQPDSAGLLQNGGIAWVSVSLPESVVSEKTGFALRTRILAFTSHNGRHSTTYMASDSAPVCDNSLDVTIAGADGRKIKVKHSRYSALKIANARDALGILFKANEQSMAFFDALAEWEVTNAHFKAMLDVMYPVPEPVIEKGQQTTGSKRAQTIAENKRGALAKMYVADPRASVWHGTALGVLQAFNTWEQQDGNERGAKVERQMLGTLAGDVGKFDGLVLDTLAKVTDRKLDELIVVGAS